MIELDNHNQVESLNGFKNLTGKILVASPIMDDEYFKRSIVYICAHDENDSAIGVMVNRAISEVSLSSLLQGDDDTDEGEFVDLNVPLYSGGPVSVDKVIALTIRKNYYRNFNQNPVITIFTDLEDFGEAYTSNKLSKKFLIAQGITAWESGQLPEEVDRNFWLVTNTTREAIFSNHKNAWEREIKKLGLKPDSKHIVNYTGQA